MFSTFTLNVSFVGVVDGGVYEMVTLMGISGEAAGRDDMMDRTVCGMLRP